MRVKNLNNTLLNLNNKGLGEDNTCVCIKETLWEIRSFNNLID